MHVRLRPDRASDLTIRDDPDSPLELSPPPEDPSVEHWWPWGLDEELSPP